MGLPTKHQAALSRKINKCDPHRLQAEKIEPLVWQEVKRFLLVDEMTRQMLTSAEQMRPRDERTSDEEKLRKKTQALDLQMEALAERIARLPKGVDERVFMNQMAKLQEAKNAAEVALVEVANRAPTEEVVAYNDFVKFTAHLRELVAKADHAPEIQAAIIKKLVHRIEVTPHGFEIDFHIGKSRIKREVGGALDRGTTVQPGASDTEKKERPASRITGSRPLKQFLKDSGSKTLTNGGY